MAIPWIFRRVGQNAILCIYSHQSHNRVLYTGVTNDLVRRLYEHKHHLIKNSFTAQYNVDKLVYFEDTPSSSAAIEREKQIKGWSRTKKNKLVESKNPQWSDLSEQIL